MGIYNRPNTIELLINYIFGSYEQNRNDVFDLILFAIENDESHLDFHYRPSKALWYQENDPRFCFYQNFTDYTPSVKLGFGAQVPHEVLLEKLSELTVEFLIESGYRLRWFKQADIPKIIRGEVIMDGFIHYIYGAFTSFDKTMAYGFNFIHCAISEDDIRIISETDYAYHAQGGMGKRVLYPCNLVAGWIEHYKKFRVRNGSFFISRE